MQASLALCWTACDSLPSARSMSPSTRRPSTTCLARREASPSRASMTPCALPAKSAKTQGIQLTGSQVGWGLYRQRLHPAWATPPPSTISLSMLAQYACTELYSCRCGQINAPYKAHGGDFVLSPDLPLDFGHVEPKCGSLANVNHKPARMLCGVKHAW